MYQKHFRYLQLRGTAHPIGGSLRRDWWKLDKKNAGPYWPGFVVTVEKSFREHSHQLKNADTVQRSGCWVVGDASVLGVVQQMGAEPSGKRSVHSIVARASSGIQAAGRAIPQLVPDGLEPAEHVSVAVVACHPMQLSPTLFPPVAYAVKYGITNNHECMAQRERVVEATITLANAMDDERVYIIFRCDPVENPH